MDSGVADRAGYVDMLYPADDGMDLDEDLRLNLEEVCWRCAGYRSKYMRAVPTK